LPSDNKQEGFPEFDFIHFEGFPTKAPNFDTKYQALRQMLYPTELIERNF